MTTTKTADETTTDEEMCKHLDESPSTEMHPVIEEGRFQIPETLREREVFIVYRLETDEDGEISKVPYKPTTSGFYKTDPTSADDAVAFEKAMNVVDESRRRGGERKSFDGIGLVCEKESRLAGFDLDDCVDLESGHIAEYALQIIYELPGGFVELSQSGTGLHIYFLTDGLEGGCANKVPVGEDSSMELELYDEHYFCITGRTLKGFSTEITECGAESRAIQRAWMQSGSDDSDSSGSSSSGGRRTNTSTKKLQWDPGTSPPEAKKPMTDEDRELIETACDADSEFENIWNSEHGCSDASVADFKLASKLAYWTAENYGTYYESNPDAMERMMRASELNRRKFDKDSGDYCYIRLTVAKAIQASDGGIIPDDR